MDRIRTCYKVCDTARGRPTSMIATGNSSVDYIIGERTYANPGHRPLSAFRKCKHTKEWCQWDSNIVMRCRYWPVSIVYRLRLLLDKDYWMGLPGTVYCDWIEPVEEVPKPK